jgi:hypothetical protein
MRRKFRLKFWLIPLGLVLTLFILLLSYDLTRVPPGINIDESSIGYNASLLARTLRDENGRRLPVFVLTLDGKDWKQPVTMYLTVAGFRLFGPSFFWLRFISVILAVAGGALFFFLLRLYFSPKISLVGTLLYFTTPSIMIQSHLALENIALIPFLVLWLLAYLSYLKHSRSWKLLVAGIALGVCFYSYKGMHAIAPAYMLLTIGSLLYWQLLTRRFHPLPYLFFFIGLLPFLLPIPWLENRYPGAIFDHRVFSLPHFYDMALTYLSSFDFTFLFLKGDRLLIHSTGRQGMFLLPTIVLFFLGIAKMVKSEKFAFYFILAALLLTPLPLTIVGNDYRASRLMAFIPLATFIFTLGIVELVAVRNKVWRYLAVAVVVLALAGSAVDFIHNYWVDYPKLVSGDFAPDFDTALRELAYQTNILHKQPYIEENDYLAHEVNLQFFSQIYFPNTQLVRWTREDYPFPNDGLVLTRIAGSGELVNLSMIPSVQSGQETFFIVGKKGVAGAR